MVMPDLFELPDGALIKTNEIWSNPKRRGFLQIPSARLCGKSPTGAYQVLT